MIKKFHILLIIFITGLLSTPNQTYACATKLTKTAQSCCKKEIAHKVNKKNFCKNHKAKNDQSNNDCGGKCDNSNCSCPTLSFALQLPFGNEVKIRTNFVIGKKNKLYHNETYLSDGFISIWSPPNIG